MPTLNIILFNSLVACYGYILSNGLRFVNRFLKNFVVILKEWELKTIPWNKANNQIPVKNTEDCCALRCCGIFLVCFYFKLELFYKVLHCLSYFALICHYKTIKLFGFYTCPENEKQMRNFFYLILNCLSGLFLQSILYNSSSQH